MIAFDCPSCGKPYTFSNKFAGRKLTCTGCKTENIIPEPEEELGLVPLPEEEPRPVPIPKEEVYPIPEPPEEVRPLPLPPPLPIGITGVVGVPGISVPTESTGSTAPGSDVVGPFPDLSGADSSILAFVFEEKQKISATPPSPPPLPQPVQPVEEPKSKSSAVFWGGFLSVLILVVGFGVYLALFIDWRGPDPRVNQVKDIENRGIQATIQENKKESESGSLRHLAADSWSETNQSLDKIILIFDEIDDKQLDGKEIEQLLAVHRDDEILQRKKTEIQDSLTVAETRLDELRKQVQKSSELAAGSEVESVVAANDAGLLKLESEFYAKQQRELQSDITTRPDIRVPAPLALFDAEANRIPLDESVTLTNDWTENFFRRFDFPESRPDRFFAAFDCARKLAGDKSLRITSLTGEPITILFPEHRNTLADLSDAKFFNFSLRFPDVTDPLANGTTPDAGKISGMSVRFGNAAGVVEFLTVSPRYCEALFFDGRGRFVSIEFPLEGDNFWRRVDNIDRTQSERLGDAAEPSFFSRIDWGELCFIPRSEQTTLWVDGIFVSEKKMREPYDLFRAEKSQEDQRKREEDRWKSRPVR